MTSPTADIVQPRLRTYASFVRLEHTLFSLPLILAGVFSASGSPLSAERWGLIATAAVAARTAGMSLNRLIDRHIDARNPRTRIRELPTGRMKLAEAVGLLVASITVYLAACALLGPWYLRVSVLPLAVFTVYPYLKRFTPFCHVGVGAALALSPLAGYAAAHPDLERWTPATWLAAFALLWVTGFDIIYATLDEEFDRASGLRSMVEWLGRTRALRVSWALHVAALAALAGAAWFVAGGGAALRTPWGAVTALLYGVACVLLTLEQRFAEHVDLAFFKINVWVGALVLAVVLAARMAAGGS